MPHMQAVVTYLKDSASMALRSNFSKLSSNNLLLHYLFNIALKSEFASHHAIAFGPSEIPVLYLPGPRVHFTCPNPNHSPQYAVFAVGTIT
ncbi:hypothetical protein NL676_008917 [Syzygium grande]|nr:hypothetical protein NL676_008917 [Syzygium grande]